MNLTGENPKQSEVKNKKKIVHTTMDKMHDSNQALRPNPIFNILLLEHYRKLYVSHKNYFY